MKYLEKVERELKALAEYGIIGNEMSESGTRHLQGFVYFKNAISHNSVKRIFEGFAWHRPAKADAAANFVYCTKEGDYMEWGIQPQSQAQKGSGEKMRWQDIKDLAKSGNWSALAERFPREAIVYGSHLERFHLKSLPDVTDLPGKKNGVWAHGDSNAGKSEWAFKTYPGAYKKDPDQWWCNYTGQATVLIEDVDIDDAKELRRKLKIWADRYVYPAPYKGGRIPKNIRPQKIIITSQYSIDEIWKDDKTREAMKNRFEEIYFPKRGIPLTAEEDAARFRLPVTATNTVTTGGAISSTSLEKEYSPIATSQEIDLGSTSTGMREPASLRWDNTLQREVLWVGCKPVEEEDDVSGIESTPDEAAVDSEEMSDYEKTSRRKGALSFMELDAEEEM